MSMKIVRGCDAVFGVSMWDAIVLEGRIRSLQKRSECAAVDKGGSSGRTGIKDSRASISVVKVPSGNAGASGSSGDSIGAKGSSGGSTGAKGSRGSVSVANLPNDIIHRRRK